MAYDESEDPEELLKFYDFEPLGDEVMTHTDDRNDLILESGTKLGNRQFMKYYKQRTRKPLSAPESVVSIVSTSKSPNSILPNTSNPTF